MTKPCKFLKGSCIYCGDTEQGECEGWNPPPRRKWVGLTDAEWSDLYEAHHDKYNLPKQGSPDGMDYERAIEAKLKELNHD